MAGKTKKDQMLVGYQFMYDQDKNPYDFVADPETGLRPNQKVVPHGFLWADLTKGISHVTLPPLQIWKEGRWLSDIDQSEFSDYTHMYTYPKKGDEFDTWVCSGEGSPGNMVWRFYLLPDQISRHNLLAGNLPKHPLMWPKALKEEPKTTSLSSPYRKDDSWTSAWKTEKTPAMPAGIRIRCTQCGHWYRMDDLTAHSQCCPVLQGFADWAIKCECCDSLDDTATVKDGYPREAVTTTGEVSGNGAGAEPAERASGDPVDAEGSVDADGPDPGTVGFPVAGV